MDKNELKKDLVLIFIAILMIINRPAIVKALTQFFENFRIRPRVKYKKKDEVFFIYQRYENYLKTAFGEIRKSTDTDQDVISRLEDRTDIPRETLDKMEDFVQHYQAVRFGEKEDIRLEPIIKNLEQISKSN